MSCARRDESGRLGARHGQPLADALPRSSDGDARRPLDTIPGEPLGSRSHVVTLRVIDVDAARELGRRLLRLVQSRVLACSAGLGASAQQSLGGQRPAETYGGIQRAAWRP